MRASALFSVRASLFLALPLALMASCTVNADYGGAGFACSDTEPCQTGFACMQGICGAALPDAGDVIACLPTIALSDEFEGDALDSQWTAVLPQGTDATVGDGVLTISPRPDTAPVRFARVQSIPFAFNEKRVFAELPTMVDTSTLAVGEFQLATEPDTHYFLRQSQGVLQFGTQIGGTELIVAATDYEPVSHRWWQMRHTGDRVYSDLSPDGTTWVNLDSVAADVIVADLYVEFSAGTTVSVPAPGLLQVDKVNAASGLCL